MIALDIISQKPLFQIRRPAIGQQRERDVVFRGQGWNEIEGLKHQPDPLSAKTGQLAIGHFR